MMKSSTFDTKLHEYRNTNIDPMVIITINWGVYKRSILIGDYIAY